MSIFQKSVVTKYLNNINKEITERTYQLFLKKYESRKIKIIKKINEEEYQDGFFRDLFVSVFNYTIKPEPNYNLVRELKNQTDQKKADGAILKDGKVIAVIELKSTKTKNLNSITEQAFGYKNNQSGCRYVITSNFRKLRIYVDDAIEYEEFILFDLDYESFRRLYLLLEKNNLFDDIPIKLKEETVFHEENVSKQLYKDYTTFKNRLFINLIKNYSGPQCQDSFFKI